MAEEINKEQPAPAEPEVKELSPTEQKAALQGWVPQEEWEGDPEAWRPAKEFLDRGELFKKIDEQGRTIKEFKKVVDDLRKHNAKIAEVEYKRALDDLKKQKKDALLEGDADAVIDIDERMAVVRDAQKEAAAQPAPAPADVHPAFSAWVERNQWYNSNKAMQAYADKVGLELGAQGMSPSDVLAAVEREVKKEFADRFTNPNRAKAGAVEGSTAKSGGKKDSFQLTPEEHRAMQRFVKTIPGYTEEKYIAEIKKIRGV